MIELKQTDAYAKWGVGSTKMTKQLTAYDPASALVDQEEIALFMADAFETGDAAYIAKALGVVARAKGMTEISQKTGLSLEQLYQSFSERGNPTLKTTLAVMRALDLDMTAKPHEVVAGKPPQKSGILAALRRSPMVSAELDLTRPGEDGREIDL